MYGKRFWLSRALGLWLGSICAWTIFGKFVVPPLLRAAHRGGSALLPSRLNQHLVHVAIDLYLKQWSLIFASTLILLIVAPALLVAQRSRAHAVRWLAPPLFAFCLGLWLVLVALAAGGATAFSSDIWVRYDSFHYLDIAQQGYELQPCELVPGEAARNPPGSWCGNAMWFPGYPTALRPLLFFRVPKVGAGVAVSGLFFLLTLVLLWTRWLGAKSNWGEWWLCLVLAAVFPGAIYDYSVFPISMATFFSLLCLDSLLHRRWLAAGLAGAAASFSYPLGICLAAVAGMWILFACKDLSLEQKIRDAIVTSGVMVAGLGLVFVVQHHYIGMWDGFLKEGAKFEPGIQMRATIVRFIGTAIHSDWEHASIAIAALFVPALCLVLFGSLAHGRPWTAQNLLLLIFAIVFCAAPLTIGQHGYNTRAFALLLPVAAAGRHTPMKVLLILIFLAAAFDFLLTVLFFRQVLV